MAGKIKMLDDGHAADLYALTQEVTAQHGLPAYEVSNHAAPGAESRHNLVYWRYGEYAGIGPGAHGRFMEGDTRSVTISEKMPERWLDMVEAGGTGVVEEERLTPSQQADEMLMMGLRLHEGIDVQRYESLAQRTFDRQRLLTLQEDGMVAFLGNSRLRVTPKGMILLDAVLVELLR
jgi:coproporphyrinogen III oxidase-like Fe-S oxidoreductase